MDISRHTPRRVTVFLAKVLKRLMRIDYQYDIILYQELKEFVDYNKPKE